MNKSEELRRRLEEQQAIVAELQAQLRAAERQERKVRWFPKGFYLAYHILAGAVLGAVASWVTLVLNVLGAYAMGLDPLSLLRVYATIIGGESTALDADSAGVNAVVLLFATGLHTVTGMVCGAPIHVVYSRYFPGRKLPSRLATGLCLGVVMWVVNFYCLLTWLQPAITGEEGSYIVKTIPWWVAASTHIAFTEVMLLLQPLAVFSPRAYPEERGPPEV